jgi:hypothetical protein
VVAADGSPDGNVSDGDAVSARKVGSQGKRRLELEKSLLQLGGILGIQGAAELDPFVDLDMYNDKNVIGGIQDFEGPHTASVWA